MRKKKWFSMAVLLMLCVSLLLAACGSKTDGKDKGDSKQTEAKDTAPADTAEKDKESSSSDEKTTDKGNSDTGEKTLTIGSPYVIGSLTPWISNSDGDRYVISNVYEALVQNVTSDLVPGLAESWEIPDDKTYVFKLRENAYWQTGNDLFGDEKVQVNAEQVKAVFDFVMDPLNSSTEQADLEGFIESVEATGEFELTIKTKMPYALALKEISDILIFPIKAIEEDFDLAEQPVGSGPYKFVEYRTDDRVKLVRNDDYFVKPALDTVLVKIIPDKAVSAIALQNGEVDLIPQVLKTDLEAVAKNENLVLIPNNVSWIRYIGFNCSNEMFQDVRVRQAISMAIDFDEVVNTLFGNDFGAKLALNSYGGGVPLEYEGADYEKWKSMYEYNPEKAETLLQEAGWQKNDAGIFEKDGKPLKFGIKSPNSDQNRVRMVEMASTYLKKIGVDASAQPTDWATMTADIANGNTEMFCMGGGSIPGGMNMLFHSVFTQGSAHNVFFEDKTLDEMLDEGYATVDDAKRVQLLKECALRALENKVHAGGYLEYVQIGMNKRVKDYDKSPTLWVGLCSSYRNVDVVDE